MNNPILIAVLVVSGLGILIGLILAFASVIFAVPKDEKAEKIAEMLPGANCGACGYSGCQGYADALAKGDAQIGLCTVGGLALAKELSALLGGSGENVEKKVALVHCMGSCDSTENKAEYVGLKSCLAANKIGGGITSCTYGCIGLGDCERACPFDAIHVNNGVSLVDKEKCKGCSKCISACPRDLISLVTYKPQAVVRCSNKQKGALTRKLCTSGCIGCMKCAKNCEADAITVKDFCAFVDVSKCTGCRTCVENCPVGCITFFE